MIYVIISGKNHDKAASYIKQNQIFLTAKQVVKIEGELCQVMNIHVDQDCIIYFLIKVPEIY